MSQTIKNHIQKIGAYTPPLEGRLDQGYLLLDFNERTVPPSEKVLKALEDFTRSKKVHNYPEYEDMNEKVAKYVGVKPDQVFLTNGSDQGIDIICRACVDKDDEVIIPSPSFPIFYQTANVQGATIIKPQYDKDFNFPTDEVLEAINEKTKLLIICNPNNPSGTSATREDIIKIIEKAGDTMVLVDEAYYEYTKETVADLIEKYPNLCVTRTFSKPFGMPSVRLGIIISNKDNLTEFNKIRGPYDVNSFAIAGASVALDDPSYVEEYVDEVMQKSKPLFENFLKEKGVKYWPSKANFILIKPENSEKLFNELKDNSILVRPQKGEGLEGTVRLCVGTEEQTKKLIDILNTIL